jgi:hypothetical protein
MDMNLVLSGESLSCLIVCPFFRSSVVMCILFSILCFMLYHFTSSIYVRLQMLLDW